MFLATTFVGTCAAYAAYTYTYTTLDFPSAGWTWAQGINDAGQIVGYYTLSCNSYFGFLYNNGNFTDINYPGADSTYSFRN